VLNRLDPQNKPVLCSQIVLDVDDPAQLSDFLEPCYLWETLYGNLQPTAAPTYNRKSSGKWIALSDIVVSTVPS